MIRSASELCRCLSTNRATFIIAHFHLSFGEFKENGRLAISHCRNPLRRQELYPATVLSDNYVLLSLV